MMHVSACVMGAARLTQKGYLEIIYYLGNPGPTKVNLQV